MPLALIQRSSSDSPKLRTTNVREINVKETELDRLLKLIPTEVATLYAALLPVAPDVPWPYFPLAMFLVGLVLVPVILASDGKATQVHAEWPQYVIRTLAFATWAMAVKWPFAPWIEPGRGRWILALAVPLVPFVGALLLRPKKEA